MAENSKIEWTDATWNPVTGCSVTSPGCTNCYAMRLAGTRLKHHPSRAGLTRDSKAGPVWTGAVRLNHYWLDQPMRWKRPRKIFVCAHGDLFHENVPDEWIDQVFAVMALAPRHTFQVLTKRSERMLRYMTERWQPSRGMTLDFDGGDVLDIPAETAGETRRDQIVQACEPFIQRFNLADQDNEGHWTPEGSLRATDFAWPLPGVWLGVSVEDRARVARLDDLRRTPAATRFVSFEPLLEDLGPLILTGIDLAITGGESGPGHRYMEPDWARSILRQCAAQGVARFHKQMSGKQPIPDDLLIREFPAGALLDGVEHRAFPE